MPLGDAAGSGGTGSEIDDDVRLIRVVALPRWTVLLLVLIGPLVSAVAPSTGAVIGLGAIISLLLWSGIATTNARRAKPDTAYETAPSPWRAMFWWMSPLLLLVPAAFAFGAIDRWVDSANAYGQSNDREIVWFGALLVLVLLGIVCWYRPYAYVGKTIAWVGGDAARARRWFWAPIITGLLAMVLFVALSTAYSDRLQDDDVTNGDVLAAMLIVGTTFLPTLVWLATASRAMRELEGATRLTFDRRRGTTAEMTAEEISNRFTMRAASNVQNVGADR